MSLFHATTLVKFIKSWRECQEKCPAQNIAGSKVDLQEYQVKEIDAAP